MNDFRIGDKVIRTEPNHASGTIQKDDVGTVNYTNGSFIGLIEFPVLDDNAPYAVANFKLYEEDKAKPTNPPHKHAELIKKWADGCEIEFQVWKGSWAYVEHPAWNLVDEYRIKPQPPKKTEQELQIEKLEATVKDALAQIEKIKEGK